MKDRADYARKGIARGRSLVAFSATDGIVIVAENPFRTLYKISEIYDRIAFAGRRQVQRVRDAARRGRAPGRPQGLLVRPRRRERACARQRLRPDARAGVHPRDEALRGRDPARAGRRPRRKTTSCTTSLRRHRHGRRGLHRARRPGREDRRGAWSRASSPGIDAGAAIRLGAAAARRARHRARRRPARGRDPRPRPAAPRVPPHRRRRARPTILAAG